MRNPLLAGERVYLRPLEKSDAETIAASEAREPDTMMGMRVPQSPLAMANWISERYKEKPPSEIVLAVCLIENDRYIGTMHLLDIDYVNRNAETGSWIEAPEFRGKGYGTEAKMLLLEYAFERLGLHVLMAEVWEPNARSSAALLKQGYRPAGRLKYDDLKDGVYRDSLLFDILRDEWLAARERMWSERATRQQPDTR